MQVQQGCDHRRTFCIIPYGRGGSRSVPIGRSSRKSANWSKTDMEAVLSGVDISSFGGTCRANQSGQMIRRPLAQVPELQRLRISSIDCTEIDDDLKRLIADEERLMPHLHLSPIRRRHDFEADETAAQPSRPSISVNYGRCAQTLSLALTSSPAFRRKPRRCSKIV